MIKFRKRFVLYRAEPGKNPSQLHDAIAKGMLIKTQFKNITLFCLEKGCIIHTTYVFVSEGTTEVEEVKQTFETLCATFDLISNLI